jgi:uncharacterized protein (DUF433 family)
MASPKIIGAAALTAALAAGGIVGATLGSPTTSGASTNAATTTTVPAAGQSGTGAGADEHGPGMGRGMGGGVEFEAAAKALGITVDELRTALEDGKSIAEVAKDKGVDKQKVIDAMVAAAEARLDEAKASLPERIAEMVDGTMPAGGPGGGHGGGPGGDHGPDGHRGAGLTAAATALGISEEDLRTALQDGKTIAEVAEEKGVDLQTVIDAMVAEAKTHLADEVESGQITQAQADERLADLDSRITEMVNNAAPAGRPGHGN